MRTRLVLAEGDTYGSDRLGRDAIKHIKEQLVQAWNTRSRPVVDVVFRLSMKSPDHFIDAYGRKIPVRIISIG